MATKKEQRVIDVARLVLLGWVGDAVDGGKAMREQLPELRKAFDALDGDGESLGAVRRQTPPCATCGGPLVIQFRTRPGGPPGNGLRCLTCHPTTTPVVTVDGHGRGSGPSPK